MIIFLCVLVIVFIVLTSWHMYTMARCIVETNREIYNLYNLIMGELIQRKPSMTSQEKTEMYRNMNEWIERRLRNKMNPDE